MRQMDKISVLLEEYRAVSAELGLYMQEQARCLTYAALLVAGYVGIGVVGDPRGEQLQKLLTYVPYAFFFLAVYFLGLATFRINLTNQRASLEHRINGLAGTRLLTWDSEESVSLQARGFIRWGPHWYQAHPTAMLAFAVLVALGSLFLFTQGGISGPNRWYAAVAILVLVAYAAYLFLIYPRVAARAREYAQETDPRKHGAAEQADAADEAR